MYPLYAYSITVYPLYAIQLPCTPCMPFNNHVPPLCLFNYHVPPLCHSIIMYPPLCLFNYHVLLYQPRPQRPPREKPRQMTLVQAEKICKNPWRRPRSGNEVFIFSPGEHGNEPTVSSQIRRCIRLCFSRYIPTSARWWTQLSHVWQNHIELQLQELWLFTLIPGIF